MKIANREVGAGNPVFVVAEISANHAGRLDLARELVRAAKGADADAVKFQAYLPSEMTVDSEHPAYRMKEGPWAGKRLWDLYSEARTPFEWFPELAALADSLGLVWFSSVFGRESLALLESLNCPAYKIASAEVTDLELVRAVAATRKPVLLSDGMASDDDLRHAWPLFPRRGVVTLRCVSDYPARPEEYKFRSGIVREYWGLSDHTLGSEAAIAAVALGACVVEKHLMLDTSAYPRPGRSPSRPKNRRNARWLPHDARHSLTPDLFAAYVRAIRATETMLSRTDRVISGSQWRRRVVFARDLPAGHVVRREDLRTARCGEGVEANWLEEVYGWRLGQDVSAGHPVTRPGGN